MATRVPFLLTLDLELAPDHDSSEQAHALARAGAEAEERGLTLTILTTADAAERFAAELIKLEKRGHEVGCHGVDHSLAEDYRSGDLERVKALLREASDRITAAVGVQPRVFRGPRMETSPATQRALVELGYRADLSVCPRRADILSCRGGGAGWTTAPRQPYRPSSQSHTRRGDVPLWVIPNSAMGLPFLSGTLHLFGLSLTRRLFDRLVRDAARREGVVVYLFHSYEHTRFVGRRRDLPLRQRLFRQDRAERWRRHERLLDHVVASQRIASMTTSALVERLNRAQPAPVALAPDNEPLASSWKP